MKTDSMFYQLLYLQRQMLSPQKRKRQTAPDFKIKPLYPLAQERRFAFTISGWMKELIKEAEFLFSEEQLKSMIQESKMDSRQDSFSGMIKMAIGKLREWKEKFFSGSSEENKRIFVSTMGYQVGDFNKAQQGKFFQKAVGVNIIGVEPWELETVKLWAQDNLTLIQGISDEYIKRLEYKISDGVMKGKSYTQLIKEVRALGKEYEEYRAKFIARDQVGKLNGMFTQRRMKDAGIEKYTWSTSMDERVRAKHRTMEGLICRWDDPTVYSTDGKTFSPRSGDMVQLHPGQDIQCRCSSIPYMKDIYVDIDKKL